jgi:Tol biopolymer transport system component
LYAGISALCLLIASNAALSAEPPAPSPVAPSTHVTLSLDEGTWMSPDITPDGRTIIFDLLGDIYLLDAKGGAARPLLTGPAFESQPAFSPDGSRIAFVSDRSGANNLWVADADGSNARQMTHEVDETMFASPTWSADGRQVYVSHTIFANLGFELWRYDADSGAGTQVTRSGAPNTPHDQRRHAIDAVASADGRYLYWTSRTGTTFSRRLQAWTLMRRDLASGADETIMSIPGGVMRPAFSRDGTKLVYASRDGARTGLRLRDLAAGTDRWLALPVDHDGSEGGYYMGVMPRIVFAPDDSSVITSVGGKLVRIALDGTRSDIPFTARAELDIGTQTRVVQTEETGPVRPRIVQSPRVSPDGKSVAFSLLGRIYTMALTPGARPRVLTDADMPAFHPAWAPDGRQITFISWTARDAGAVWIMPAGGGKARRLTKVPAYYTEPLFTPDGKAIVALRSEQYDRMHMVSDSTAERAADIVRVPLSGGEPSLIAHAKGARILHFARDPSRVLFYAPQGLSSVALTGGEVRRELIVQTRSPNQYVGPPVPVESLRESPAGDYAIARAASQLWLVRVAPGTGKEPASLNLMNPQDVVARVTRVGADYFDWADGGKTIVWAAGPNIHRLSLADALLSKDGSAEARAQSFEARVELPRDTPRGKLLLHGATVATMRGGDEVIRNADLLVIDDRIAAVGPAGTLDVPAGTTVRDVTGKYILPGFIDTHAHWTETRRDVIDIGSWVFGVNLAYGVTAGLDPQSFTPDVFAYQDAIDAGLMVGMRVYSTGPGIFWDANLQSVDDATAILSRYRDDYRTRNIKSYMVGSRRQRSYLLAASRALGMMPTTEGASDLPMNLTHALDGYAGNEHNLPISPLHEDVIELFARSRTSYTPTFVVMYGAQPALDDMVARHPEDFGEKLRHFIPSDVLDARTRNMEMTRPIDRRYPEFAADALAIQRAGGVVGLGSHGMMQGIAYHWELEAFASGGGTPLEAIRAATIGSAETIGHQTEIGSLEPGKFADLQILDRDPLADIRNSRSIAQVMKNGRLYDANTLDEVWPRQRPYPKAWFAD